MGTAEASASGACRPALAENDPLDHFPGAEGPQALRQEIFISWTSPGEQVSIKTNNMGLELGSRQKSFRAKEKPRVEPKK